MNAALYCRLHSSGQLLCPAGGLRLLTRHPKQALFHRLAPCISPSNGSDPLLFVQRDQPAAYQCPISGPWGPYIAQPLREVADNQPQLTTCRPNP